MYWLPTLEEDSEHFYLLCVGLELPRKTQHSQAPDGMMLYLHREEKQSKISFSSGFQLLVASRPQSSQHRAMVYAHPSCAATEGP